MPKPIIMTADMKRKAIEDFTQTLEGVKMSDGKLSYNKSFDYEACNAVVCLSLEAYKKTISLVTGFTDEVGWHGTVSRCSEKFNEFVIEDIFVYPQEVSASTVNTDQQAYTMWLYELDDSIFNKIRMQGHSHCNMGVSPSGVDDKHRQQILDQLETDMFYIFMIWNRSLSVHTLVYDMARNVLYEDTDVEVKLLGGEDMDAFLMDAKAKVSKPNYKATIYNKHRPASKGKGKHSNPVGSDIKHISDIDDIDYSGYEYHLPFGQYERYRLLGGEPWGY